MKTIVCSILCPNCDRVFDWFLNETEHFENGSVLRNCTNCCQEVFMQLSSRPVIDEAALNKAAWDASEGRFGERPFSFLRVKPFLRGAITTYLEKAGKS